jgi:hypothetical protein
MNIIKRTRNHETHETLKGDLPIHLQVDYDCALDEVIAIRTYNHTITIEFTATSSMCAIGGEFNYGNKKYFVLEKDTICDEISSRYLATHYQKD